MRMSSQASRAHENARFAHASRLSSLDCVKESFRFAMCLKQEAFSLSAEALVRKHERPGRSTSGPIALDKRRDELFLESFGLSKHTIRNMRLSEGRHERFACMAMVRVVRASR